MQVVHGFLDIFCVVFCLYLSCMYSRSLPFSIKLCTHTLHIDPCTIHPTACNPYHPPHATFTSCTQHNSHPTAYMPHPTPCTTQPYTLHPTPTASLTSYILHFTTCNLHHPIIYILKDDWMFPLSLFQFTIPFNHCIVN